MTVDLEPRGPFRYGDRVQLTGPKGRMHTITLREAGELRLAHKEASLEELGKLADPVLTKDAVAGRIRRLLSTADKRAAELGIPDTEAGLSPELLDL